MLQLVWIGVAVTWQRLLRRSPRVEAAVVTALADKDMTAGELVDACRSHNEQEVLDVVAELRDSGRLEPRSGLRGATLLRLTSRHEVVRSRPRTF